jgi:hypothetical protein
MRRLSTLIALLAVAVAVASCGGSPTTSSGANPAAQAPGIAGLERDIQAAHGAVATSQTDAARASGTSAGP